MCRILKNKAAREMIYLYQSPWLLFTQVRMNFRPPYLLLQAAAAVGPVTAHTYFDPAAGSCNIIGDADIYGLGIRLSYYLQWAAVLIGMIISPKAANAGRNTSNIVTMAVFINSIYGADNESSLMILEWQIVLSLVFFLLFFNLPTSEKVLSRSIGSLGVSFLNGSIVLGVEVWLSWTAHGVGAKDGCDVFIFIFAPVSAYSPKWIVANKILSLAGIAFLWGCIGHAVNLFVNSLRRWGKKKEIGNNPKIEVRVRVLCGVGLIVFGTFCIAFAEMTIKINHITFPGSSLTDSGQLIPIIIGAFNIVSVFWEGFKKFFSENGDDCEKTNAICSFAADQQPLSV